jgi:hypothetical protein
VVNQQKVLIVPKPANILIEQGENNQYINFDFLVISNSRVAEKKMKTILDLGKEFIQLELVKLSMHQIIIKTTRHLIYRA